MKKTILLFILVIVVILMASCESYTIPEESQDTTGNNEFDKNRVTFLSAYTEAQNLGFEGTLEEFIEFISGKDGADGIGINSMFIDDNGDLLVILSDGSNVNCGKVKGSDGKDGIDGVTPTIEISSDGYWIINGVKTEYKAIGVDGTDGKDGVDGVTPTIEISSDGYWVINGVKTEYKAIGADGTDGKDGADGSDGTDGKDGVDGVTPTIEISSDGYWVINGIKTEYKAIGVDGTDGNDGIDGSDGVDGKDGAGIKCVVFDEQGRLVITLTDGTILDPIEIPKAEEHVHRFGNLISYGITDGVNCEDRLYYRVCSECKSLEWMIGSYQDHQFVIEVIAPTCIDQGYDIRQCLFCAATETTNHTDALGHSFNAKYSYDDSYHWQNCDRCNYSGLYGNHDVDDSGYCTVCDNPISSTKGIVYSISSDKTYATVTDYTGSSKRIVISFEYQGLPVKSIENNAFERKNITSVIIPQSITSIGSAAFKECENLVEVIIPQGVTSISDEAFYYCRSLTNVTIPSSVTLIGYNAFSYCTKLKAVYITDISAWCKINFKSTPLKFAEKLYVNGELLTDLVIPEDVRYISNNAFYYCTSLTSVTMHDNVYSIGEYAFAYCTKIKSIVIPDGVNLINRYAFSNCTSITSITIGKNVSYIDNNAFSNCVNLTEIRYNAKNANENKYNLGLDVFFDAGNKGPGITLIIGNEVKAIPQYLFHSYSADYYGAMYVPKLTSIIFEENSVCEKIGDYAFYYCESLFEIELPDTIRFIGSGAFHGTGYYNDESNWTNDVLYLNNYLLKAKTTLNGSYEVDYDTLVIAGGAFSGCNKLTSIVINENVRSIGNGAFYNCTKLTTIYYNAAECANMSSHNEVFSYAGQGGDGISFIVGTAVKKIPSYLFYPYPDTWQCPKLVQVMFDDGSVCEEIGSFAFSGSPYLTNVELPDSLVSIGSNAFRGCSKIKSIKLGKNVTSIGACAFYSTGLYEIIIPISVTTMGNSVFEECSSGLKIYCEAESEPVGWNADWNLSYQDDEDNIYKYHNPIWGV